MRLKTFSISILAILLFSSAWAGGRYSSETYHPVIPPQPTQTGDKIEVLELFWYGCPHCYDLEHYLDKWLEKKPDDVVFRRMPAILGKGWIPHARAYFTAEKLGIVDQIHRPLFDAIHKDGEHIIDEGSLKTFFAKHGVDADEFSKIFNSEEVEIKVKESFVMGQRYKVTGVPTIIINGKYRTSASITGSNENLFLVIDQLVEKERNKKMAQE